MSSANSAGILVGQQEGSPNSLSTLSSSPACGNFSPNQSNGAGTNNGAATSAAGGNAVGYQVYGVSPTEGSTASSIGATNNGPTSTVDNNQFCNTETAMLKKDGEDMQQAQSMNSPCYGYTATSSLQPPPALQQGLVQGVTMPITNSYEEGGVQVLQQQPPVSAMEPPKPPMQPFMPPNRMPGGMGNGMMPGGMPPNAMMNFFDQYRAIRLPHYSMDPAMMCRMPYAFQHPPPMMPYPSGAMPGMMPPCGTPPGFPMPFDMSRMPHPGMMPAGMKPGGSMPVPTPPAPAPKTKSRSRKTNNSAANAVAQNQQHNFPMPVGPRPSPMFPYVGQHSGMIPMPPMGPFPGFPYGPRMSYPPNVPFAQPSTSMPSQSIPNNCVPLGAMNQFSNQGLFSNDRFSYLGACAGCKRQVNENEVGLRCTAIGKGCQKIFHANNLCAGLSCDALFYMYNNENIEFVCEDCAAYTGPPANDLIYAS